MYLGEPGFQPFPPTRLPLPDLNQRVQISHNLIETRVCMNVGKKSSSHEEMSNDSMDNHHEEMDEQSKSTNQVMLYDPAEPNVKVPLPAPSVQKE
jgi:hypothetical protein